jgi:hypothetical protein
MKINHPPQKSTPQFTPEETERRESLEKKTGSLSKNEITLFFKEEKTLTISPEFLATHSEFVRNLISHQEMQGSQTITLHEFSKEEFETLLEFLATKNKALLSSKNALQLISLADYLLISDIVSFALPQLIEGPSSLEQLLKVEPLIRSFFRRNDLAKAISNKIQEMLIKNKPFQDSKIELPFLLMLRGDEILDSHLEMLNIFNFQTLLITNSSSFSGRGLETLTRIDKLNLFKCRLKDEDFEKLPSQLSTLNLSYTKEIGTKALKRFKEMGNLKDLNLQETEFRLVNTEQLPQTIEILNLSHCIYENSLCLKHLSSLKSLNLMSTGIKDSDLKTLPNSIEILFLNGCDELTESGVLELKTTLPKLKLLGISKCKHLREDLKWEFPETIEIV